VNEGRLPRGQDRSAWQRLVEEDLRVGPRQARVKAKEETLRGPILRTVRAVLVEPQERLWDGTGPRGFRKEKTPESVRNAERGTNRGLGTPGRWTSGTSCAEGDRTLGELAKPACRVRQPPPVIL
jgi:hypothetical protein